MNADDVDVYYFKADKTKNYKIKLDTGDNIDKDYRVSIFVKNKKKAVISEKAAADKTFTIKAGKGNKVWIKIQADDKLTPFTILATIFIIRSFFFEKWLLIYSNYSLHRS